MGSGAGDDGFWTRLRAVVAGCEVVIDRRRGSRHPRFPATVYPLDYGHLAGTASGDGQGIDVWIGSLGRGSVTGVLATIDVAKRDAELKVLIDCTPDERRVALAFQRTGDQGALLLDAPSPGSDSDPHVS